MDVSLALAEAALSVAHRRAKLLDRVTAALVEERTEDALRLMRVYCGLEEEDAESDRTPARLD